MNKYFLAIDIGASSGRHIIGYKNNNKVELDEIYRFPNGMKNTSNGLCWDLDEIFNHVLIGIKKAFDKYKNIVSLSIDTWGVDYVLIKNGQAIKPFYAYRNSRTHSVIDEVHSLISFDDLYKESGIQFQEMNTVYQLYKDKLDSRINDADYFLMIPEYLNFLLTGIVKKEYTNASTTGLLNAHDKIFSNKIINALKLNKKIFAAPIYQPGEFVGKLKEDIANFVGGQTDVILCPSHDTASAFESIETDDNSVFISSGTWSLIGVKSNVPNTEKISQECNFTNEGGVNYIRFLKNIMGMWIPNQLLKEYKDLSIGDLVNKCYESKYEKVFDVNDASLVSPVSMKEAVFALIGESSAGFNEIDLFKSVFDSLALSYKNAIDELEKILKKKFDSIYIVGGGAKNKYLNEVTEKITNKKVIALPIEATTLGNLKYQFKREQNL